MDDDDNNLRIDQVEDVYDKKEKETINKVE